MRGGPGRSRNFAGGQRLTERCGRLGCFEAKRLFWRVPAPYDSLDPIAICSSPPRCALPSIAPSIAVLEVGRGARSTTPAARLRARKNLEINPMDQSRSRSSQVSRCGAKTRAGTPCKSPPVQGRRRCRSHGGLSPGAPRGSRNGNYTNGEWTAEALEERRWLRSLARDFANEH